MFEYRHIDPFILSSSCPYSCSLVSFASRVGGILDPDFLSQCQITDKNFEKLINNLKQIPLKYEYLSLNIIDQQEIFLDMDIQYNKQFMNLLEFKQYNLWLNNQKKNFFYFDNDELII